MFETFRWSVAMEQALEKIVAPGGHRMAGNRVVVRIEKIVNLTCCKIPTLPTK